MSDYRLKYLKYKSKYINSKLQNTTSLSKTYGGNYEYTPNESKVINIDKETTSNKDYRRVIHTTDYSQLVLMRLKPGVEIGMELHDDVDQFIRVEQGHAKYSKGGERVEYTESDCSDCQQDDNHVTIYDNDMKPVGTISGNESGDLPQDNVLLVPRNTWHNVWNPKDATEDVFIYTVYSFGKQNPPHEKDMKTQHEKEDEPKEEKPM